MPPALDRLVASPSARRLLRSLLAAHDLPPCLVFTSTCSTRHYATTKPASPPKWRRWKEPKESVDLASRNQVLHSLLLAADADAPADTSAAAPALNGPDAAWAATLTYRERHDGRRGVEAVWNAICADSYRLPVADSPHAQTLWGTFVKHPALVPQVIEHAASLLRDTGQTYPRLYELTLGHWLPRYPSAALDYHHELLDKLHLQSLPLRDLLRSRHSQLKMPAYEALLEIYRNSNERDLYDDVMQPLIDGQHMTMARRWHNLCTSRGDVPSYSMARHPVVELFIAGSSAIARSGHGFTRQATREQSPVRYNKDLMRRLLGQDTAPVRFEDTFCARMFATRTFSPESIIKGLAMAGVNEIGPQALLTMASRTQPLTQLPMRFEELRASGIALQGCVFSLALEKFTAEGKWDLVESMLNSDQHPDVFGDADVQRTLLQHYLEQGDSKQAQRTLAILTLFHNDPSHEAWNMLLQLRIDRSRHLHVMDTLNDMRAQNVMLSDESVNAITNLLRPRKRGHKPVKMRSERFDDLRFVTRIYMTILETGMARLSPFIWREIIRRFGMLGRLRELRRLMLWLMSWYAPQNSLEFYKVPRSPFLNAANERLRVEYPSGSHYFTFPGTVRQDQTPQHPIRQLFRPVVQQALIIWGFRAGLLPNAPLEQSMLGAVAGKRHYRRRFLRKHILKPVDWSIGLRILVQLRDLGLNVHQNTVRKALQMQFVVMFGYGTSNIRSNRIIERQNKKSYAEYVRQANAIWGHRLFFEPDMLSRSSLFKYAWHPRLQTSLARRRKTELTLTDALGSGWHRNLRSDQPPRLDPGAAESDAALNEMKANFTAQEDAARRIENRSEGGSDTTGGSADADLYGLALRRDEENFIRAVATDVVEREPRE